MASKLTIRDIARIAGVSTTTVSRVLNHKPDVDPVTRERILQIVSEHRYTPSISASSLAGGKSRLLGVLTPSLTWPFMPNIMQGIAEIVEQTSYELVLYSISHRTDRSALLDRILAARLIDGLIAVYPDGIARVEPAEDMERDASIHLLELYQQGFPIVELDDQSLPGLTPWVGLDNRVGAYNAVRHLLDLGHRRIAHIRGPMQYQCSQDRYQGYRQALAERGIEVDTAIVVQGDFTTPSGLAAADALLDLAQPPTAVFVANDQMAYGVIEACLARGLRLPEQLAIIGFDDTALSALIHPALTTVRQPFQEMGKSAAYLLLSLVEGQPIYGGETYGANSFNAHTSHTEAALRPMRVQLPTELVIRESCGARLRGLVAEVAVSAE